MGASDTADRLARIERASGMINDERFRTGVMAQAVPYSSPVASDAAAGAPLWHLQEAFGLLADDAWQ